MKGARPASTFVAVEAVEHHHVDDRPLGGGLRREGQHRGEREREG